MCPKWLFTFVLLFCFLSARAQQYQWVHGGGTAASTSELTNFLCTDQNGNVYAANQVGNDPVYADTFYSTATYAASSFLVTSYTKSGHMRWAKLISSSSENITPLGMTIDQNGHLYLSGDFGSDVLHIGTDTTIAPIIYSRSSIIQLDTDGHFKWIRYLGENYFATLVATGSLYGPLCMDNTGNVHLITPLGDGAILAPGDTSKVGNYDFTYDTSGILLSIKHLNFDSTLMIENAAVDLQTNRLFCSGTRVPEFTLSPYDSSIIYFIAEFDTARNLVWIDTLNDGAFEQIAADGKGHIYTCGSGNGVWSYRGDTVRHASADNTVAIFKLDTAGNPIWNTQFYCNYVAGLSAIALVGKDKVATTGTFVGTIRSKLYTDTLVSVSSSAGYNAFFAISDTGGNVLSLINPEGDGDDDADGGYAITADAIGNIYIGGAVSDSLPTGSTISAYHSVGGNSDFFVLKYGIDTNCTAMPVANYTVTGTSTISATYTGTTSGVDSVTWSFGDTTYATGLSATHTYTDIGTMNLCVTVYTGCGSDVHCSEIVVNCPSSIISSFTDTGSTVRGFTFTGTLAALDSVSWNFGDGTRGTGTTPVHTYSASGTYSVCATVYTSCGSAAGCNTVVVNCTPLSSFTNTGSTTRNFTYTGTTTSLDSVHWNFGDGYSASGLTSSHTYSASGTFTVCATVRTSCGVDAYCDTVVIDCTPVASFTHSGSLPASFTYTGGTYDLDSVVWHYGDGTTGTGTASTHSYSASGTYTVCVIAYAMCGNDTSCNSITIDCNPSAAFILSGSPDVNFTYTGTTTGIDSVVWNYGDGTSGTGTALTHTYTASGTYTICATAYAECGSSTICHTITINCLSAPVAETVEIIGTNPYTFGYIGTIVGYDSIIYSFGDGTYGSGFTANHTYSTSGTYTVCATIYTDCGSDSACVTVRVVGVGVPQLNTSEIQIFPNPVKNELTIANVTETCRYRLLTITGSVLEDGTLQIGSNLILLAECSSGVYILELTDSTGEKRFVRVVKE